MIISNIINDSFGLLSKQLRFYCWHFRRNLDHRQRQELVELLYEQHFENLANKIKTINQSAITDCRQQIGKLLFEHCFARNRRHQLIQLIESDLVDINVRLDNYGRTLLHRSAYNLDVELVKLLIAHGVNIRLRDYAGNTALHIAIQSYRNGAIIYGNGSGVVQNLTSIITLLLEADDNLQNERFKRKKIRLSEAANDYIMKSFPLKDTSSDSSPPIVDCNNNNNNNNEITIQSTVTPSSSMQKSLFYLNRTSECSVSSSQNKTPESNADLKSTQITSEQQQQQEFNDSPTNKTHSAINPILLEDLSSSLVDTKNAFGRTALHYCVLVVGEQHLAHFVQLLISFGANTDAIDSRMKTPLYFLVKRPGVSIIRNKCQAIAHLLNSCCDDLGLAISAESIMDDELIKKLETSTLAQKPATETSIEPIFTNQKFKRVPSLKHISRLKLIKLNNEKSKLNIQVNITLPEIAPKVLNLYINRKILDQSELI